MELTYRGGNCIEIAVKKETIVIDGHIHELGLKNVTEKAAVYIATQQGFNPVVESATTIDGPGEYEARGISVKGVSAQRMLDDKSVKKSTIYRIVYEGVTLVVVGHVFAPLSDEILEEIGVVDIAIVPVGGGGYTLDGHQAAGVVRQLEPEVVIPTHYADIATKYEVPQEGLNEFLKEMGGEHETVSSYKIKGGILPATLTVIEITRS